MAAQRRDVGRVIFGQDNIWTVLTLSCHVDNVVRLVKSWDPTRAYLSPIGLNLSDTQAKLIRAAEIHDQAKPAKFRLRYREHPFRPGVWQWEYSFAGHRFEVYDDDPYTQELARLHHEYSVEGITSAIARLQAIGEPYADNLPLDLYTLEMCDQIEATVARAALGGDPEERVFMDFHIEQCATDRFALDPFPFLDEAVMLVVEYAQLVVPKQWLHLTRPENEVERGKAEHEMTHWIVQALQEEPLKTIEVALCPLVTP